MAIKNNPNKCVYCGACVGVCPTQAIVLKDVRIVIDNTKCISCGACVTICPAGAMELENKTSIENKPSVKKEKKK